ncbi:MAG: hypothetical protein AABX74_06575 [Nanoarchaeota archaeon]
MEEAIWKNIPEFERHPKLREEMKKEGDEMIVTFLSDGKTVSAETLEGAFQRKNISNIKAVDSIVLVVEKEEDSEKREVWHKVTDFRTLRQLKEIRDANGGTLVGARVKVTRIAVNKPKEPNWQYELVGEGA